MWSFSAYWIDRRLTGLAGPDYDAPISFGLPLEPEDSQYGKSRVDGVLPVFRSSVRTGLPDVARSSALPPPGYVSRTKRQHRTCEAIDTHYGRIPQIAEPLGRGPVRALRPELRPLRAGQPFRRPGPPGPPPSLAGAYQRHRAVTRRRLKTPHPVRVLWLQPVG